jgi:hypothetical protein
MESLVTAYADACAKPKPNYSLDGQSVSWGEYLKMLTDGIDATAKLIGTFSPVESRSIML